MDSEDGFVVRARGLPWSTSPEEIVDFFSGCEIVDGADGIKFIFNNMGRPSGECFVEFKTNEDFEEALKKDKNYLQSRYVEVFKSKRSEMEWVTNRNSSGRDGAEGLIKLRGLPFSCSKEEIAQFFSGLQIEANGITLPTDFDGRKTGVAFVQFASKENAEKALLKHKSHMGHRYIEVFKSSPDDLRRATNSPRTRGMNRPGPYDRYSGGGPGGFSRGGKMRNSGFERRYGGGDGDYDGGERGRGGGRGRGDRGGGSDMGGGGDFSVTGHSVHMRGLPFNVTEADIKDFFHGAAMPFKVIVHEINGKRNGFADVDFRSHSEAKAAMKKDRNNIGNRYIELFLHSTEGGGGSGGGGSDGGRGYGSDGGYSSGFGSRGGRGGGGGGNYRDNQMGGGYGGGGYGSGGGGGFYGSGGGGGGNNYRGGGY